jgi:DNA polymerase-3 subunit delta'
MEINWLKNFAASWQARVAQDRMPHAVMLVGAPGVGKRCAAAWIAKHRLRIRGATHLPEYPLVIPEHPDLRWLRPPEDKQNIGIEQIRELVADLSLTSFDGGGKVAVIEPANMMTANAANSLLKTLEEPPGDALLVLVTDRTGRLPATIFSRCQRVNIPVPAQPTSLAWLDRLQPAEHWTRALRVAGGAPIAAITAAEHVEVTEAMSCDFFALSAKRAAPLEVAAKWAKYDPGFVLDWMCREVQKCIVGASGATSAIAGQATEESVLKHMDRRNLFCYLDIINRLRGQPAGSFNVQLTLESLLIDWAGELRDLAATTR